MKNVVLVSIACMLAVGSLYVVPYYAQANSFQKMVSTLEENAPHFSSWLASVLAVVNETLSTESTKEKEGEREQEVTSSPDVATTTTERNTSSNTILENPESVTTSSNTDTTTDSNKTYTTRNTDTTDTSRQNTQTDSSVNNSFSDTATQKSSTTETRVENRESNTIENSTEELVRSIEEAYRLTEDLERQLLEIRNEAEKDFQSNATTSSARQTAEDESSRQLREFIHPTALLKDTEMGEDFIEKAIVEGSSTRSTSSTDALRARIAEVKQAIEVSGNRDVLVEVYADSDNDGVSDYDEKYIYNTDPFNPRTAGTQMTDGERILSKLNPLQNSEQEIVFELPNESETISERITTDIFTVESASLTRYVEEENGAEMISFTGKALPNSFVTLYIFSTPIIVTVKTDSDGVWRYTLDQELEDGSHTMYVATVNNSGKIIAQSSPFPFVKEAQAVTLGEGFAETPESAEKTGFFQSYLLLFVLGGLLLAIGLSLLTIGILNARSIPDTDI
ncbi:MAG: Ig-like domain-containing protein [Candidatus Paceibacterota bacterium]